ncbi:hypothetical protein GCM10023185_14220 [Hymenobacter saemangeumensis]|uniref:DUF7832 domain-containing protein n=1 Tax=Hymenobacter saemangeumensis TaxID=1084522 RepID=A0ABP8I8L2_9BACT
MKYDDATWHSGGDYPSDLPDEAAATHSGMFLAWALLKGLGSEGHLNDFAEELKLLQKQEVTPGAYFLATCDGQLSHDELSETGNFFAAAYLDLEQGAYFKDYEKALATALPSFYHVPDTWENFELLRPILESRFAIWSRS